MSSSLPSYATLTHQRSRFGAVALASLFCCAASHLDAQITARPVPEERTALLIGVWDYQDETFPSLPQRAIQNDLKRMESKLRELGFEVTSLQNPNLKSAKAAVDTFGADLKQRGGASLFYFTGHGAEHEGRNFLIPSGTDVKEARDLDSEALAADRVLARMESSGVKVNLVFLDCCRNSLTKSGGDTGLAAMTAKGALIGFATRSGDVADANEDGSPYTNALLKHLGQPGVSLPDMHTLVTRELENAGSKRRPGQYVDLGDIYHLVPAGGGAPDSRFARSATMAEAAPIFIQTMVPEQAGNGVQVFAPFPPTPDVKDESTPVAGRVVTRSGNVSEFSFQMSGDSGDADRAVRNFMQKEIFRSTQQEMLKAVAEGRRLLPEDRENYQALLGMDGVEPLEADEKAAHQKLMKLFPKK